MLTNAFTHASVDADVPVLRVRARSEDGAVQLDGTLETTRQPLGTRTDLMFPSAAGDAAGDQPVPHVPVSVPA